LDSLCDGRRPAVRFPTSILSWFEGTGIPARYNEEVREEPLIEPILQAVVFREGEWWILQVLEYDLATQVWRLEDVPGTFHRLLLAQILANAEHGVEPFHGFSRAPKRYWEMYERAEAFVASTLLADVERVLGNPPRIEARLVA
jgi:hypothetical protein